MSRTLLALASSSPAATHYSGGVALDGAGNVCVTGFTIMLLRLPDGASFALKQGHSYLLADLVQRGLYYSYEVGRRGRLAFEPRSQLLRRLR
jgi:hypothetical protein